MTNAHDYKSWLPSFRVLKMFDSMCESIYILLHILLYNTIREEFYFEKQKPDVTSELNCFGGFDIQDVSPANATRWKLTLAIF